MNENNLASLTRLFLYRSYFCSRYASNTLLFRPLRVKGTLTIEAAIRVRTKVITLCLGQVGGQAFAAIGIEVSQRGAHRQDG